MPFLILSLGLAVPPAFGAPTGDLADGAREALRRAVDYLRRDVRLAGGCR